MKMGTDVVKNPVGVQVPVDADIARRIADDETIKKTLEEKSLELSQEIWFDNLCELEKVNAEAVRTAASARIQKLDHEDNIYRLGESYWRAKERRRKYKRLPSAFYITAVLSLGLAGIAIGLIVTRASAGYSAIAFYLFLLALSGSFLSRDIRNRREGLIGAPAEYAKATTDIDRGIRSLIEQSVRDLILPDLLPPCDNIVGIGDGANLSSRVEEYERIITRYRPAVELHMLRSGGAAVGITGERGTGKSELLRSFCDATVGRATVKDGGTIGVVVAVPAAFQGAQFLTLVAERLARAVPGYRTPEKRQEQRKFRLILAVSTILSVILIPLGLLIYYGQLSQWRLTDHELGLVTVSAGLVLAEVSLIIFMVSVMRRFVWGKERGVPLKRRRTRVRKPRRTRASLLPAGSAAARSSLGRDAEHLMLRLKYAETVTSQGEGSVSGGGVGFKIGGQRTLSSIPLSEASLISEIETLSDRLAEEGYRIIIGIDEMDKLEAGQSTEDFLNSIKQLFSISSCSFLVSVSSSAWVRFVQRGVNVRDALDSSLDAIEQIGALDFLETRSLILHRREAMSDTEILFCYVLAGGFPREVMRCAQSIAISNRDAQGSSRTLNVLAARVLNMELDRLIDASRSAVSGWEFHDRDRMFRRLDDIAVQWRATTNVPVIADAVCSATRGTNSALPSSHAKSEDEVILLRLGLMAQFLSIIRQLFCTKENWHAVVNVSHAEPSGVPNSNAESIESSPPGGEPAALAWSTKNIPQVFDTLAGIRRMIETDPTAALQQLSKVDRQLDKETQHTPAGIADLSLM